MPEDRSLWDSRAPILMSLAGSIGTREVLSERLGLFRVCPLSCPWLHRPEAGWVLGSLLLCPGGTRESGYEKSTLRASEDPPRAEVCSSE